jgi:hypothetical protein
MKKRYDVLVRYNKRIHRLTLGLSRFGAFKQLEITWGDPNYPDWPDVDILSVNGHVIPTVYRIFTDAGVPLPAFVIREDLTTDNFKIVVQL